MLSKPGRPLMWSEASSLLSHHIPLVSFSKITPTLLIWLYNMRPIGGKEEEPVFTQGLVKASYHMRCFAYIISFHLHARTVRQVLLSSYYRWENWSSKRLGPMASGAARIQPWVFPRYHTTLYIGDYFFVSATKVVEFWCFCFLFVLFLFSRKCRLCLMHTDFRLHAPILYEHFSSGPSYSPGTDLEFPRHQLQKRLRTLQAYELVLFPKGAKCVLASDCSLQFPGCISRFGWYWKEWIQRVLLRNLGFYSGLGKGNGFDTYHGRVVLSAKLMRLGPRFTPSDFYSRPVSLEPQTPNQPSFMLLLPHLPYVQSQNVILPSFFN